jgi:hypothetical protein
MSFQSIAQTTIELKALSDSELDSVRNYVNCMATKKYLDLNRNAPWASKIKDLHLDSLSISISNSLSISQLKKDLKSNDLSKVYENLALKLNDRELKNKGDLYFLIKEITNFDDFKNFNLGDSFGDDLAKDIIDWYVVRHTIIPSGSESVDSSKHSSASDKSLLDWKLFAIVVLLIIVIVLLFILFKLRSPRNEGDEYPYKNNEIGDLKDKIYELNSKYRKLAAEKENLSRENSELEMLLRQQSSQTDTSSNQSQLDNEQRNKEENEERIAKMNHPLRGITLYASLDVVNNRFAHVSEKSSKQSTYQIDPDNGSFKLIKDEDLFEMCLANLNSYGILDACDVEGTYYSGKTVKIVPGRVKKEDKGWAIVEKCKIKIV